MSDVNVSENRSSFRVTVSDCPHTPQHDYSDRAVCRSQRYAERSTQGGRLRRVVDSAEVAHLWAHKAQSDARNAKGSIYFREDVIYSYGSHFPIARHVANKAGESAVLFTTASYSVTTSGHCSTVRGAVSHLRVFDVANVLADSKPDHTANLQDYAKRIDAALLKSARARSKYGKTYEHGRAVELRAEAIAYAKFIRCPYAKTLPTVPALDSTELLALKTREVKRLADQRAKTLKENVENIARWRAGEYARLPFNLPDMLRMSKDGTEVETSRGVSFPASHAKRGLALVRSVRERGEDWHTNGHTCHLGHYRIDSISALGNVKAGCHSVAWSEIERIAPALDALSATADQSAEQPENA